MNQGDPSWKRIPEMHPADLPEATQQLHQAAQFLAATGHSFLTHQTDDSHTNMNWVPEVGLQSRAFQLDQVYSLVLNYELFRLELMDSHREIVSSIDLNQKNKETILEELEAVFKSKKARVQNFEPVQHYELPAHPIDQGAPFHKASRDSLLYLRLLRDNANALINWVNLRYEDASEMRIWPHHFDNGSICVLEMNGQNEMTKTVGWGFSIPNETDEEHHFYINHWSKVSSNKWGAVPNLPDGAYWATEGKLMAILPIRALSMHQTETAQVQLTQTFFEYGIKASRRIVEA
ncbi:MAG: hypothetical protein AAF705_03075 [Bacteroidota bacterium]